MLQGIEELSPTKRKLNINVPKEIIQSETDTAYNELKATAKIPGFRPGKVPQSILVKKFGKDVEAQIIERVVPRFYMEAIKEADIEPVTYPDIEDQVVLKPGEELNFSVTVEIKPVIGKVEFEGIKLEAIESGIDEADLDRSIISMQESRALYSATDEALKEEDMAVMDSDAFIDGEPREELTNKEFPFVLGSESMPKEFTDALMGKKKGDTAEVSLNFEADYQNKELAGKTAVFNLTVKEAKKKNLPPLDDEFAKEAGFDTMEKLKEAIRENLVKRKEGEINLQHKKVILDALIKKYDFDVPETMVEGELKSIIENAKETAIKKGETLKSDEELRTENEKAARENVKSVLLIETIGKQEKVEVNDDDIKEAIEEIAVRNHMKPEEVTKLYAAREGSIDALRSRLFADKVLEYILERSTIEKKS